MNRFVAISLALVAALAITAGCKNTTDINAAAPPSAPVSEIVTKFEQGGGGDPVTATPQGLTLFLSNHPDLSHGFMIPCLQRQTTADSNWIQSPEGRICYYASEVVATRRFYGLDQKSTRNTDTSTFGAVPSGYGKQKK